MRRVSMDSGGETAGERKKRLARERQRRHRAKLKLGTSLAAASESRRLPIAGELPPLMRPHPACEPHVPLASQIGGALGHATVPLNQGQRNQSPRSNPLQVPQQVSWGAIAQKQQGTQPQRMQQQRTEQHRSQRSRQQDQTLKHSQLQQAHQVSSHMQHLSSSHESQATHAATALHSHHASPQVQPHQAHAPSHQHQQQQQQQQQPQQQQQQSHQHQQQSAVPWMTGSMQMSIDLLSAGMSNIQGVPGMHVSLPQLPQIGEGVGMLGLAGTPVPVLGGIPTAGGASVGPGDIGEGPSGSTTADGSGDMPAGSGTHPYPTVAMGASSSGDENQDFQPGDDIRPPPNKSLDAGNRLVNTGDAREGEPSSAATATNALDATVPVAPHMTPPGAEMRKADLERSARATSLRVSFPSVAGGDEGASSDGKSGPKAGGDPTAVETPAERKRRLARERQRAHRKKRKLNNTTSAADTNPGRISSGQRHSDPQQGQSADATADGQVVPAGKDVVYGHRRGKFSAPSALLVRQPPQLPQPPPSTGTISSAPLHIVNSFEHGVVASPGTGVREGPKSRANGSNSRTRLARGVDTVAVASDAPCPRRPSSGGCTGSSPVSLNAPAGDASGSPSKLPPQPPQPPPYHPSPLPSSSYQSKYHQRIGDSNKLRLAQQSGLRIGPAQPVAPEAVSPGPPRFQTAYKSLGFVPGERQITRTRQPPPLPPAPATPTTRSKAGDIAGRRLHAGARNTGPMPTPGLAVARRSRGTPSVVSQPKGIISHARSPEKDILISSNDAIADSTNCTGELVAGAPGPACHESRDGIGRGARGLEEEGKEQGLGEVKDETPEDRKRRLARLRQRKRRSLLKRGDGIATGHRVTDGPVAVNNVCQDNDLASGVRDIRTGSGIRNISGVSGIDSGPLGVGQKVGDGSLSKGSGARHVEGGKGARALAAAEGPGGKDNRAAGTLGTRGGPGRRDAGGGTGREAAVEAHWQDGFASERQAKESVKMALSKMRRFLTDYVGTGGRAYVQQQAVLALAEEDWYLSYRLAGGR